MAHPIGRGPGGATSPRSHGGTGRGIRSAQALRMPPRALGGPAGRGFTGRCTPLVMYVEK